MPLAERADPVQDLLADRQDLALERVLVGHLGAGRDDRLGDVRHRLDDPGAEAGEVGRHLAPGDQALPLDPHQPLDMGDGDRPRLFVERQKAHRHGIAAGRRQLDAARAAPVAQQRVGHLDQAAGAVADQRVGAHRAAVIEVDEDLQPAADDVVRLSALDIDDKADPARIMLVPRVVKTLSDRPCHSRLLLRSRS